MILFLNKKVYIITVLSGKGVEKMKYILNCQKSKKKADSFFRKSWLFYLCCALLCLAAIIFEERTVYFQVCIVGAGLSFLRGLIFLCLAAAEGQEPYLAEPQETLSEKQMEELKEILDEAQERIRGR